MPEQDLSFFNYHSNPQDTPQSGGIDYSAIYQDMQGDPVKYYTAYGNNKKQYASMLNFTGFMSTINDQYQLPLQYTQQAQIYGDLLMNPDSWTEKYGSRSEYDNALKQAGDLFNIEKKQSSYLMDLMDKSSVGDWKSLVQQTPELGQMFQYGDSYEDNLLASINYAPLSFSETFTPSKVDKAISSGYEVGILDKIDNDFANLPTDKMPFGDLFKASLVQPSVYLQKLYQYDMNDPDDVLNKALGLMPKSFKYDKTDEDVARQSNGQLPKYAEDYVINSEKFNAEYANYAESMQKYADDLYQWQNGPNTGFLGIFKGAKPTEPEAPEMVQAIMEYKDLLNAPEEIELQTPYEKYTEETKGKTIEAPNFYFGDISTLPFYVDENRLDTGDAGYFQADRQAVETEKIRKDIMSQQFAGGGVAAYIGKLSKEGKLTEEQAKELWRTGSADSMARAAADVIYENDFIQELKDAGVYESVVAEGEAVNQKIQSALTGDVTLPVASAEELEAWYTPEKVESLKNNLGIVAEMLDEPVDWYGAVENGMGGLIPSEAKKKLDSLGWKGELESDNPEIQKWLDIAAFTAIKRDYDYRKVTLDNMKNSPSWLIAIYDGLHSGVTNVRDSALGLTLEIGKLHPLQPQASRDYLDKITKGLAQSGAYRRGAYQEDLATAQGGATDVTKGIFNITSAATELGITLAAGKWLGSYGGASSTAAKATSTWGSLAKKALFNKELVPLFMSSLGGNLMEGELKGYNGLQNWLVALPTAYMEAKTESMFGFFSKSGSAYKLFKNGIGKLSVETLGNFGRVLAENTLGETFEEIIQSVAGSAWEGIVTGKSDPINFGDTVTTTMGVGLLMTLFGLPAGIKSYSSAKVAESSFNKAIAAYENGDTAAYESAIKEMMPALSEAITNLTEDFRTGELDRQAELIQIDENLSANINQMDDAIRRSMELRQMKEDGQDVPQGMIDFMDARANSAITSLKSIQGVQDRPATVYDQIMNDPDLVRMVNGGGLTADMIKQNGNKLLTDAQIQTLRDVDNAAQNNPYINVKFDASTTPESLQADVSRQQEKLTSVQAEYKKLNAELRKQIDEAANVEQAAALANSPVVRRMKKLNKQIESSTADLADSTGKRDAFNAQQGFRQMFEQPVQAPVGPVAESESQNVQTPSETESAQQPQTGKANRSIPFAGSVDEIEGGVPLTAIQEERLEAAHIDIAQHREAVNKLREAGKVKISTKDMTLKEVAAALENHAQYLEGLADGAKDIKKPSISVTGLLPNEIESIGRAVVEKKTAVANLRSIAKSLRARADAVISAKQSKILNVLNKYKADRKITPEFKRIVDRFAAMLNTKSKSMSAKSRADMEFLKDYAKKTYTDNGLPVPYSLQKSYDRLDKMQLNDLAVEDLDAIETALLSARKQDLIDRQEERTTRNMTIAETATGIKAGLPKKLRFDITSAIDTPRDAALSFGQSFMDSVVNNVLDGSITHGRNEMFIQENVLKPLDKLVGKEFGRKQVGIEKKKVAEPTLDTELYPYEILHTYAVARDVDGFDELVKIGYDPVKLQKFVTGFEKAYPKYFEAYGLMRKALEYYLPLNNEVSRHTTGADMVTELESAQNPDYFPLHKDGYYFKVPETETGGVGINPTYSVARTGGGEIKSTNPLWAVYAYHQQANQYTAYASAIYDSNRLLNTSIVRETFQQTRKDKTGTPAAQRYFRNFLFNMATGKGQINEADRTMSKIRSNIAGAKMSFSPTIPLKQLGAYMGGLMHIKPRYLLNPFNLAMGIKTLVTKQGRAELYNKVPDLYERIEEGYMSIESGKLKGKARAVRAVDAFTVAASYYASVDQARAEGLKGADLDARASKLFHDVLWDTQQMYGAGFTAPVQQSETAKWFLMFASQQFQQKNMLRQSIKHIQQGNVKKGAWGITGVILNTAVYAAIVAGVSKLFKIWPFDDDIDDGKEFLQEFSKSLLSSVAPIFSRVAGSLMNEPLEMAGLSFEVADEYGVQSPVIEGFKKWIEAGTELSDENKSIYGKVVDMAIPLSEFFGVPAENAEKWTVKAAEAIFPDFDYDKLKKSEEGLKDYKPYNNQEPKRYYPDLKNAIASGNEEAATTYMKQIIEQGGSLDKFLKAKTGGESLTPQQKAEATRLWATSGHQ
jgi:hypothetical protein